MAEPMKLNVALFFYIFLFARTSSLSFVTIKLPMRQLHTYGCYTYKYDYLILFSNQIDFDIFSILLLQWQQKTEQKYKRLLIFFWIHQFLCIIFSFNQKRETYIFFHHDLIQMYSLYFKKKTSTILFHSVSLFLCPLTHWYTRQECIA